MRRDNGSFRIKQMVRSAALRSLTADPASPDPVVLETHAGLGKLWQACYAELPFGVAIELDRDRAARLARQRPTWAVYSGDAAAALAAGLAADVPISVVDVDPYGDPWPALRGFLRSERVRVPALTLIVNDGLRRKLKLTGGWSTGSLQAAVEHFGSDLHDRYLDVCRWLLDREAREGGYSLAGFSGAYAGHARQMTHYVATLRRAG